MTGPTKTYLAIAFLITGFLVGNAYGNDLIVDVHFDDGSVLHNAKLKDSGGIKVKYENEFFTLNFKDLKTLIVIPGIYQHNPTVNRERGQLRESAILWPTKKKLF